MLVLCAPDDIELIVSVGQVMYQKYSSTFQVEMGQGS